MSSSGITSCSKQVLFALVDRSSSIRVLWSWFCSWYIANVEKRLLLSSVSLFATTVLPQDCSSLEALGI